MHIVSKLIMHLMANNCQNSFVQFRPRTRQIWLVFGPRLCSFLRVRVYIVARVPDKVVELT